MKKFVAWMNDRNGWIPGVIILTVLVLAYGSILGAFPSFFFAKDVKAASGWWHLLGWALTAGAIGLCFSWRNRDIGYGEIIFLGVLIALSWCAFAGFTF